MDEIEARRYAEAKRCESCLEWHKYCNAECCRVLKININPEDIPYTEYLTIDVGEIDISMVWYYRLREIKYLRGLLRIPTKYISIIDGEVFYIKDCMLLDGCLCKGHPDKKPKFCRELNLENIEKGKVTGAYITPNCLFKYKCKEVIDDAKKVSKEVN